MTRIIVSVICAVFVPAAAAGQAPPRFEISGSAGSTRAFRFDDQSFGRVISPGVSFEWRVVSKLGLGIEVSHAGGLEPRLITCDSLPGVTCTGSGRDGVLAMTIMSVTGAWHFDSNPAVQPYLIGGVDVMSSRVVSSLTMVSGGLRTISEVESRDRGMGVTLGAGLRIPIGRHVALRPELRLYDGVMLSRENLSATRASIAVGYRW